MTNLDDVDPAEAAARAEWLEYWKRWGEERGRLPNVIQEGEGEAGLLRKMAPFGWTFPKRPGESFFPEPFSGVSLTTGEVYDLSVHAIMVLKTPPGAHGGTSSDLWAAFACAAVRTSESLAPLRALTIFRVYATLHPSNPHHDLAGAVVAAESPGLDEERATKAERALAGAIADRVRDLGAALGWDWPGLSKFPRLNGSMIPDTVDIGGLDIGASLDRAADFLEGFGPKGTKAAAAFRGKTDPGLWVRPSGPLAAPDGPTRSPLMWALAAVLWADVVGPKLDREASAKPFRNPTVHEDGCSYVTAPKPLSSLSWALGGHGERVEVDGEDYRPAPGLARYAPRMLAALPSGKSPAQRFFPLDSDDGFDDAVPMESRIAADARMVVSELGGKLAVLLMVTAAPGLSRLTVGELTKNLNPDAKRYQGRDFENVVKALNGLKSLAIVPPRYAPINLFELTCPREGEADPELPVFWGFSKTLDAVLASGGAAIPAFNGSKSWNGSFLLNLSKMMRIPAKLSVALRLYLHSAAKINEVRNLRPHGLDAMPWLTAEQWAALGNTVSPAALDYARERTGDKRRKVDLSEARGRAIKALDYLNDEGLLIVEADAGKGPRRKYRVKPTEAFEAAYRKILKLDA